MGKHQNVIQRERNRKGNGTLSAAQLISCYIASALIVILCVMEATKPETAAEGSPALYYLLAVLGIAFSVFITVRSKGAKKKPVSGPRLNP